MKPSSVLTEEVIHPDVKGLVIDGREVCPNGKIRDHWEGNFNIGIEKHQVSSLEGCPSVVANSFQVNDQKHLRSFKGSPEKASHVNVWKCPMLQDLTGITPDCDSYWIEWNDSLLSLDGILTTEKLKLDIIRNPKLSYTVCQFPSIKSMRWVDNKDVSLHDFHRHFPKITKWLTISDKIKSHALSVLLIEGLQKIHSFDNGLILMVDIINHHLPNKTGKKGMLRCQAELIDAGYTEHAQL